MDTLLPTKQHRKQTKRPTSTKKKPIKVKYISNPMKVETSASEFRALVQELTGQDAEFPVDSSNNLASASQAVVLGSLKTTDQGEPYGFPHGKVTTVDDRVPDEFDPTLDDEDIFVPDQITGGISFPYTGGWFNEYCSQVDLLGSMK